VGLNIVGEACGNFVALSYASASVVAPLGAVSLVVNGLLAQSVLGEHISRRNQLGYLYLILGVFMLVAIAPQSTHALSVEELADHLTTPSFLVYLAVLVAVGAYLSVAFVRRRLRSPESHVLLAAVLGAFSVLCSKTLSVLLRLSFVDGQSQFASILPYGFLVVFVVSAVSLEVVKQSAITLFDASCFWPLFFAGFNLIGISFSLVLSQELAGGGVLTYAVGFVIGLLLMWQGAVRIGGSTLGSSKPVVAPATTAAPVVGGAGTPAFTSWIVVEVLAAASRVAQLLGGVWDSALQARAHPAKVAEP